MHLRTAEGNDDVTESSNGANTNGSARSASVRRVSVVVPTRDRPELLDQALASIRAVEGPDLVCEIFVCDNGSLPETAAVAARRGARYLRVEKRGAAATRNAGLRAATGEFIAHLDDDDLWTAEHIRPHLALLDARPDFHAVVGQIQSTALDGTLQFTPWPAGLPDDGDLFLEFMRYFPQVGGTVSRTSVRDTVGYFDESLLGDADWDWQLRIAKTHKIGFVPVPCVLFRQRPVTDDEDDVQARRVPYTRKIFLRHALPEMRRWSSPLGWIRSYGRTLSPYYRYFARAAQSRAERGDRLGATKAILHAVRIGPARAARDFVLDTPLRAALGSLLSPTRPGGA